MSGWESKSLFIMIEVEKNYGRIEWCSVKLIKGGTCCCSAGDLGEVT